MGEVRDRMEQDLFLRGVAANTRETYLRYAKQFVAFHRCDPRQLDSIPSVSDVRMGRPLG